MAFTVAVAGKGGTGKTTLAALIINELLKDNLKPLLAVDADPNVNLNVLLGLEVAQTIGQMREDTLKKIKQADFSPGMSKSMYLEYQLQQCLTEGEGFDLLVMGRPEGPGCYCFVNDILRKFIDTLTPNYRYVVIDTEAGMEHLSRRTTQKVDILFILSDPSPVSLRAAERINKLVDELNLKVKRRCLILNNTEENLNEKLKDKLKETDLELAGVIPKDENVLSLSIDGKPLKELPPESVAVSALRKILEKTGVIG